MLSLQHSTLNYNNYDSLQYSTPNYNNYDLHKQNKDRLSITEEASQESSKSVAETFSPDRVQKILVELGFGEDNVASWNEPIEVPFGVSSTLFIARVAIIYGLPFRHIDLYPELEGIYVHGGEIPKIVKDKIQSLSTEKIVGGKTRDEIPANIFAYEYKYRSNEQKINVISQIRDKFGDQKKFLYRGINSHSINLTLIEGFMDARHQGILRKEFGVGLYTTPDIEYAVSYARRNGSLLIFDWTDPDGNLMFKDLSNLEEWKATVKGYICINDNNKPRPPQHREDIIEGPISSNYESISRCSDPIPSETIQIVAKTDSGINAFASRLFAIIYLK